MATHLQAATAILAGALLAACTQQAASAPGTATPVAASGQVPAPADLFPSRWIATEIAGAGLVAGSTVTLAFKADGAIGGSAGCNRYLGQATLGGGRFAVAPLATTRMACVAPDGGTALMDQESRYLDALGKAERILLEADGGLALFSADASVPTRFRPDPAAVAPN